MATQVKIPIPQSGLSLQDQGGRPLREWYQFWEGLGTNVAPLASLPLGRIWIGNAASVPVAYTITGDITISSVGVAQLQDTANVTSIVNSIISDSATNILANQIFGA